MGDLVHATCVALYPAPGKAAAPGRARAGGAPAAVLLRGPSGTGKSDLALRLMDGGARLVADDQTQLSVQDGGLVACAPAAIAGRMEVRGLGIAEVPRLAEAPVCLVVDLVPGDAIDRLPQPGTCELLGITLPLLQLDPFEASAPAKLRLALAARLADAGADIAGPRTRADAPEAPSRGRAKPGAARPEPAKQSPDAAPRPRTLLLVTGMSGAGRSTALSHLEDLGYESIDNLPLDLVERLVAADSGRPMALGIDTRTRHFAVQPILEQLEQHFEDPDLRVTLLFLDCEDEALGRRFTETRRGHPLAKGRPVADGIAAERRLIPPLRVRAGLAIDTTGLAPAELRRILAGHFSPCAPTNMVICVTSFSYRNGLPRDADLVFDVRFLKNPHYDPALRPLSGRDRAVADYVAEDSEFAPFFGQLTGMLAPLLPGYRREGKNYLTIAVGCTGGRHRSVVAAERLARWLTEGGETVTLLHRDLKAEPSERPEGA
jgi:RNase adaptor protein for sRNA GlmZ degradation